jgi:inorganic pyrophosphatase
VSTVCGVKDLPPSDVSSDAVESFFEVVIEIPSGTRTKYEVDSSTGTLWLDRVLSSSSPYPFSYGFLPASLSLDGDPLDAVVLCSEPLHPLTHLFCRAVAVLNITDQSGPDEKLICVPISDPAFKDVVSLETIPAASQDEIETFFTSYKATEPGKWVELNGWGDSHAAYDVLKLSRTRFHQNLTPGT